jgi:Txe/YoeB family toxin of Txe-Axe toxin-antitoxin module
MKPVHVTFTSFKIDQAFDRLLSGKHEEQQLSEALNNAIAIIKQNPLSGTKIPRRLWPRTYTKNYQITNLWKYNLPHAWRMVYTIYEDTDIILVIILEWFSHKQYERTFKY